MNNNNNNNNHISQFTSGTKKIGGASKKAKELLTNEYSTED